MQLGYAEVFLPDDAYQQGHSPDLSSIPPFVSNIKAYKRGQLKAQAQKERKEAISKALEKHGFKPSQKDASQPGQKEPIAAKACPPVVEAELDKNILDVLSGAFNAKELNTKKITIRSKAASVVDVIEMIGRLAGIDFVIDSDVTGKTGKINCKNCTAGEILNHVTVNNTPKLAVVKYLNLWRVMLFSKAIALVKAQLQQDYIHHVFKVHNTKFDDTFKEMVSKMWKNIVGAKDKRAYILFDMPTRRIFIYALGQHVDELGKFLHEVDRAVPQVRIDVVIVTTDKAYIYDFGFNITGVYDRQNTLKIQKKRFGFAGLGVNSVPNASYTSLNVKSGFPFVLAAISLPYQSYTPLVE